MEYTPCEDPEGYDFWLEEENSWVGLDSSLERGEESFLSEASEK